MKMLKVKDIYELEIAKFMHSYYHCKLSENFGNYFKNASNHHKYNTGSIVNDNYSGVQINWDSQFFWTF